MAGAEAVGGKFFTGEMDQPNVTGQFAGFAQPQKALGAQHQGGSSRMIVVCATSCQARAIAAVLGVITIKHVRCVIMIGHDNGPAAIPPRNNDAEIALLEKTLLIVKPTPPPPKTNIRPPAQT